MGVDVALLSSCCDTLLFIPPLAEWPDNPPEVQPIRVYAALALNSLFVGQPTSLHKKWGAKAKAAWAGEAGWAWLPWLG